jgi:hypothetical protein
MVIITSLSMSALMKTPDTSRMVISRSSKASMAAVMKTASSETVGGVRQQQKLTIVSHANNNHTDHNAVAAAAAAAVAEPPHVSRMMDLLLQHNLIVRGTILGDGGGGYLALIASKGRKEMELQELKQKLCRDNEQHPAQDNSIESCTWHECQICEEGMRIFSSELPDFVLEWHTVLG